LDECQDSLELMAATLAYFRLSSRRYVDMVPMAIRLKLLEPLAKELGAMLREKLLQGLALSAGEAAGGHAGSGLTSAEQLMEETPELARKRAQLDKRYALLQNGKGLLDSF
jgi:hypothetical protein